MQPYTDLTIQPDAILQRTQPAFGAIVRSDQLLVPPIVAKVLESLGIEVASEFLSYAKTYPDSLAELLTLDVQHVERESQSLETILRDYIDVRLFDAGLPEDLDEFGFGAILSQD